MPALYPAPPPLARRLTVVVLTHNRVARLLETLDALTALPERPRIVVVDNASQDGTGALVARRHPTLPVLRNVRNDGTGGRNLGVEGLETPYVAFCDDDMRWAPGALPRAVEVLERHPRVALVQPRVQVGPGLRLDPVCVQMQASPLPSAGLPGPALVGFLAGSVVMRREAFDQVGGFEPRFFIGAEEALMSFDLRERGWSLVYRDDVTIRHDPAPERPHRRRQAILLRNRIWTALLRLPVALASREIRLALHDARRHHAAGWGLRMAFAGLAWTLRERRVVSPRVAGEWALAHFGSGAADHVGDGAAARR